MPICLNCSKCFSARVMVDGKLRILTKRKYCLDCHPLSEKGPAAEPTAAHDSTCSLCAKTYKYDKRKGHTRTKCGSCSINARRKDVKKRMVEYKGGKCSACGYNKCFGALTFHHLDSSEKELRLGDAHCRKWEVIVKELDKCILLCSNCHAELHYAEAEERHDARKTAATARFGSNPTPVPVKRQAVVVVCTCGKEFPETHSGHKYCSAECAHAARRKIKRFTKAEMLQLVWEMPTAKIAKQYGVADHTIAKMCKKLGVDKPPRGYWNKVQAGKPV